MKYQVLVYGSVFYETDDEGIAYHYAYLTKQTWGNAEVKEIG